MFPLVSLLLLAVTFLMVVPPRRLKGLMDRLRGTPLGEALAPPVDGPGCQPAAG